MCLFADERKELAKLVAATDIPGLAPDPVPSFLSVPRTAGQVPVGEITARARSLHPGKALLTVIGSVLFGAGWGIAKTFGAAWLCIAWTWSATEMGWSDARGKGPSKSSLIEENEQLRMAVRRLGGDA